MFFIASRPKVFMVSLPEKRYQTAEDLSACALLTLWPPALPVPVPPGPLNWNHWSQSEP